MSWIIRLQNLPWSANSMDIRMFFNGLSIPDGGVHIVGGEMGDAFIAFSTDEDARQAMSLDGSKLKEIGVRLLLSSRAEMQKVIETARQQTVSVFQLNTAPVVPAPPVPNPQLLLAQQFLQQQQQQLSMYQNPVPTDFVNQQMISTAPLVAEKNRNSVDNKKPLGGRDRRRDSRSSSRDRYSRDRSRSRDRSASRDRSRRNRSRSRSRERSSYNRRRRTKRSYSRDRDGSDRSRDSDSRDSRKKSRTPPKPISGPEAINPWNTNVFQSVNTNNGRPGMNNGNQSAFFNNGRDAANGFPNNSRFNANSNNSSRPIPPQAEAPKVDNNTFAAFQRLRERRNETAFQANDSTQQSEDANASIDLTEDDHNCCVKLSNLETSTGYGEIRRFLQGLPVQQNGLKMINDDNGRRTGVAYVQFHRSESRKFALMRSGQVLNGNKIVVNTLDDREFDEAIDAYRPPIGKRPAANTQPSSEALTFDQIEFTCLKVTNVPTLTTEQDIMKIYSDYGLMHIIITKDKQKRNCAFLKLNRSEDAKRALREKNNYPMGHKNIVTVTMCSEAVFEEVMNANAIEETSGYGSQEDATNEESNENLRASQNRSDRSKQFEKRSTNSRWGEKVLNLPPIPAEVLEQEAAQNAARKTNSRWATPAVSELPPPAVASNPILSQLNLPLSLLSSLLPQAAATMNQEKINPVDPRLQQAATSRDPRLKNISTNLAPPANTYPNRIAMQSQSNSKFSNGDREEESDCVVVSNLEASSSDLDVAAFFSKIGAVPKRVHILLNTMGQPSGDAFVEFPNSLDATKALQMHEQNLGKSKVFVETIPRQQVDEVLASFGGGGRDERPKSSFPPNGFNSEPRGMDLRNPIRPPFPSAMMGNPARPIRPTETNILALNNVPYRAGVDDIIGFFSGYNIRPQDIMRRFNDAGQATAEAKVRFKDSAEARKALEERKFTKMLGRTIYLEFDH